MKKLLVFRRNDVASSLCLLAAVHRRATNMVSTTWKLQYAEPTGKTLKLEQIYKLNPTQSIENNHWQAKVRQVLQDARFFIRIEVGVYALAE